MGLGAIVHLVVVMAMTVVFVLLAVLLVDRLVLLRKRSSLVVVVNMVSSTIASAALLDIGYGSGSVVALQHIDVINDFYAHPCCWSCYCTAVYYYYYCTEDIFLCC